MQLLDWPPSSANDEAVRDLRNSLNAKSGLQGSRSLRRSPSDPGVPRLREDLLDPEIGRLYDVAQPGGFRRHHVRSQMSVDSPVDHAQTSLVEILLPMLRESDLSDSMSLPFELPALPRRRGDASNIAVGIVIAKNFFGSCFLITPKGFQEAGMIGGPVCLLFVYLLELRCMLNLIECRKTSGRREYAQLAGDNMPRLQSTISSMIIACQFGFCCIWLVTNMDNLSMIWPHWSVNARLWVQFPVLLPLVWIRHLRLFAVTNLIGIAFTAFMVVFFFIFMGSHLAAHGPEPVVMVNTQNTDLLLWLGTTSYAYEGINVVLPLYESARSKETMPKLLSGITAFITLVYIAFGCLTYLAFGTEVASLATLNLPEGSAEAQAIPGISVIIGLASFPLQCFVIFQTYEPRLGWSTSYLKRKWQKNVTRSFVLLITFLAVQLGGDELDNFLALVGGFCCASLALIFPSALHLVICSPTGISWWADVLTFIIGLSILILSTTQALTTWK
eukprot:TRINITY_DN9448_c0_g1_i1.p1 TRINITY_DN9448_c0_g1~~TRINITY_DN9448_c0_g1_i1.p1  ORF type:complete len:502 (-),score=50.34 TRINITY_DN9448_c0_g1_i1:124-1629(-)